MGKPRRRQVLAESTSDSKRTSAARNASKETKNGLSIKQLALLFLVLALVNYVGLTYYWYSRDSAAAGSTVVCTISGNVSVKQLKSTQARFAKKCAKDGIPVVLKNSIVTRWKAQKWTPKYLQSKLGPAISGVYENDNRWFGPYFDVRKPLASYATPVNSYRTNLKLPTKEFFRRIQSSENNSDSYLYFTGDIDQLGAWALDEIEPLDELLALNPQRSSINVWMGQPHVIAHCHYDGYHNFYAQLYGRKKFTLIRPSNWPGLYPYPFLHPSHAQAQVNLSNSDANVDYPLVEKVEAFEAYLEPGDLLYVPPLWFHHVESLDVSISVNVWTDSHQTELMKRAFEIPLPTINELNFPDQQQQQQQHTKAIVISHLLNTLLRQVCKYKDCAKTSRDKFSHPTDKLLDEAQYFLHRLWTVRYRTLMEKGQLPNQLDGSNSTPILCEFGDHSELKRAAQEAVSSLVRKGTTSFEEYAETIAQVVKDLPVDTWELWLGNYVEFVIASAVNVEHVGLFLKHCRSCLH